MPSNAFEQQPGHSLVRTITFIVVAMQVIGALGLSGERLLHERQVRVRAFDQQIEGKSDSLLGAIQDAEDPADNVMVDPAELRLPGEDSYAVYDEHGRRIACSGLCDAGLLDTRADGVRAEHIAGKGYRVLQKPGLRIIDREETKGAGLRRPVTLVYASPDGHIWHEVLEAASHSLLVIALTSLVTLLLVVVLVRRALSPLADLAAAATQISAADMRFETPDSANRIAELRPLSEALTRSVAALHLSFKREQRFFDDAAHELKTAVAVVRSSVQLLLLKPRATAEYARGLESVLADNVRVEILVSQMLQIASLDREQEKANLPSLPLATAVSEACGMLHSYSEVRGVRVEQWLDPAARVRITLDDARTLVTNLVVNAIQHSVAGSVVVVVVQRIDALVRLRVTDSGSGIGAEALPHVFERFYREDQSRTRETGGSGLGLSICKAIVDAAEGNIEASSTLGKETSFLVTFTQA